MNGESQGLPPYTAKAIKATALLAETKALLRTWTPGESSPSLLRRAREESLLGKATASRSDDVVANAFVQRFLSGERPAAPHLKQLLEAIGTGQWFTDLGLLYAARADVVLREAITVYAVERRASGRTYLDTPSLIRFIEDQQTAGRMPRPWSTSVKETVARHVLRQMTDFGLASPSRRGVRELLPFQPTGLAIAWLAYDLHFSGLLDSQVLAHPDWGLWALDPMRLRERLNWLARPALWEVQAAGNVIQITWTCQTMEEAIDVLARNELQ
jgi:hypothetical protein